MARASSAPFRAAVALLVLLAAAGCDVDRRRALDALGSANAAERARGLQQLARMRASDARQQIAAMARDKSARVRLAAVAALGAIGVGDRLNTVIERLADRDLEVRLAAARVLGDSRRPAARRALLPVLEDRSMVVRQAASRALEALGMSRKEQRVKVAEQRLTEEARRLDAMDEQVRASAAAELGRSGRQAAVGPLLGLLDARSPLVLRALAAALAQIGGERAAGGLERLARSKHAAARAAAASALARARPPRWALLATLAGDGEQSQQVRRAAMRAVAAAKKKPSASLQKLVCSRLTPAAVAADVECAGAAALAAGRHGIGCDLAPLVAAAEAALRERPPPAARVVALARLLVRARAPGHLRVVVALYGLYRAAAVRWVGADAWRELDKVRPPAKAGRKRPPSQKDRRKAISWLLSRYPRRRRGERAEDPLLPPSVRPEQLATMLSQLAPAAASRAWLAELAERAPRPLRLAALRALGATPGRAAAASAPASGPTAGERPRSTADPAARAIGKALAAKDKDLRRAAVRGCHLLGAAAGPTARRLLADSDFEVRAGAARCLGELGDTAGVKPLLKSLKEERQLAVIEALATLGDRRATPAIARLLRDDHAAARQGERVLIIEALGRLGDPAAAPALERELAHPEWQVRLAAARALARAGRAGSRDDLQVCQEDYYKAVRQACTAALLQVARPKTR